MLSEQQVELRAQVGGLRVGRARAGEWRTRGTWRWSGTRAEGRAAGESENHEGQDHKGFQNQRHGRSYDGAALPEWLLVDGSSMIFRAFYGIPQTMRGPDGSLVNAVRGSMDNLARYITERKPRPVPVTTAEDCRPDSRLNLIPRYMKHPH